MAAHTNDAQAAEVGHGFAAGDDFEAVPRDGLQPGTMPCRRVRVGDHPSRAQRLLGPVFGVAAQSGIYATAGRGADQSDGAWPPRLGDDWGLFLVILRGEQ